MVEIAPLSAVLPFPSPLFCSEETPQEEKPPACAPPKLVPPHQVCKLIQTIEAFCDLREQSLHTSALRLREMKNTYAETSNVRMQQLQEAAERARSSDSWGLLQTVANSLLAGLSALTGLNLITSGGSALVGGVLITSGIVCVTNLLLSEYKGWDWMAEQLSGGCEETKQQLLSVLPAAVGIAAAGCSLTGSIYALSAGPLNSIPHITLSLFSASTSVGKGVSDAKLTWKQAELLLSKEALHIQHDTYEQLVDATHTFLEELNRTFRHAKRTLRQLAHTQSQLMR